MEEKAVKLEIHHLRLECQGKLDRVELDVTQIGHGQPDRQRRLLYRQEHRTEWEKLASIIRQAGGRMQTSRKVASQRERYYRTLLLGAVLHQNMAPSPELEKEPHDDDTQDI